MAIRILLLCAVGFFVSTLCFGGDKETSAEKVPPVVNPHNGEVADGSGSARLSRPGLVQLVRAERSPVFILHRKTDGAFMVDDDSSQLVAVMDMETADGRFVRRGENIPGMLFLGRGVLKNPGPNPVTLYVVADDEAYNLTIEAGDGLTTIDGIDMLRTTHVLGCVCTCTTEHFGSYQITSNCPGCNEEPGGHMNPGGAPGHGQGVVDCCCEKLHSVPCFVNVGEQLEQGTTSGCIEALVPA